MTSREQAVSDAHFLLADALEAARARICDDRTRDAGGWYMAAYIMAVEAAGCLPPLPPPPRSDDD
ncbi:MAG: hypothetical protein MIL41_20405 [Hyphomicrobiales bacterium]|jgi:hypothetical protein